MADQFTRAVIAAGLSSAADEMFEVLRKTAMSPIIYEVLDVGTGITDPEGALVCSGAGIPSFIGVLDKAVTAIRARARGPICEGDVFLVNDPNHGGVTHLNDVVVAEPIFHEGDLVAWAASIAHWGDIGGSVPGSMSVHASEIIAEGLRLPVLRLYAAGQRNEAVFDILRANTRLPDFMAGDLAAQVAAGRRAARSIRSLCSRYGTRALFEAIAEARATGSARARAGLAQLPALDLALEEPQDDGPPWKARITITADRFTVDLREAPAQSPGPYNTSRDGAVIACQMFFKALTDPERFANAGSFEPLQVLTRPGTIFEANEHAAQGYYFETRIRLFDMLWHGVARALPERLPAGHFGTIFGTVISGTHPQTGQPYAMVEPQMGGWGASAERPGTGPLFSTSHGDTFNCPAEIAEARYGFDVAEQSLIPPAPGQNGGPGLRKIYVMRGTGVLSAGYSHQRVPVWSLADAPEAGRNALRVISAKGQDIPLGYVSGYALSPDDRVVIETSPGGGHIGGGQHAQ